MAGVALRLVPDRGRGLLLAGAIVAFAIALAWVDPAAAQSLYKFRGENGEWIYADRPPADGRLTEKRELEMRARVQWCEETLADLRALDSEKPQDPEPLDAD